MGESLKSRMAAGERLLSAWLTQPEPLVAEAMLAAGFDAVTLDLQHGQIDYADAVRQISAVRHAGGRAIARVPVGEYQTASRLLDAGVDGVIAPMIDSVDDARAFGAFMKYPPLGRRSWGPTRTLQLQRHGTPGYTYAGADAFRAAADAETMAIVMVETRRALDAIEDILALAEIDGVFVGPGDLSLALTDGRTLDVDAPDTLAAIERVARCAEAAGKPAAIFAATGTHARRYLDLGYRFVTPGSDIGYLTAGARSIIAESRD
jgi:4-hydroxy-2-oxoheptanedioate aldolase